MSDSKSSNDKPADPETDGPSQWAYGPTDEDSWGVDRDLAAEVARYKAVQLDEVDAEDDVPSAPPGPPPKKGSGSGRPSNLPAPRQKTRPEEKRAHSVPLPYRAFPPKVVSDTMTRRLIAVSEDEALQAIEDGMKQYEVRHFPVVDADNRLIGMVSWEDVLLASSSSLSTERERRDRLIHKAAKASHVMRRHVPTVRPDTPIMDAADIMQLEHLQCLAVTADDGTLCGILTTDDFMQLAIYFLVAR